MVGKESIKRRGFTLIELVVVIAILAIIAAVAIPTLSGVISDAQHSACRSTAGVVYREYLYGLAADGGEANEPAYAELFRKVVVEGHGAAAVSSDCYTGLCPEGGKYTCIFSDNGGITITCSKHGAVVESDGVNYVVKLAELNLPQITTYFSTRTNYALDSTADMGSVSSVSWAHYVNSALQGMGIDTSKNCWKIYKRTNGVPWEYYWTYEDVTAKKTGDTVKVTKYIAETKTLTTGTMKITTARRDKNSPYYNILQNNSFQADS